MSLTPLFLSPALPSELLAYVISKCTYPTTLIVCSTRADFLTSLADDVRHQIHPLAPSGTPGEGDDGPSLDPVVAHDSPGSHLLASPLFQVAIAKHIRVVFVPTVSHLRVFLSPLGGGKVAAPPPTSRSAQQPQPRSAPLLLVFGFLALHRDTSEWSAQGLSNTAAALVDAAAEAHLRVVVVEPARGRRRAGDDGSGGSGISNSLESAAVLGELIPVLSSSTRRAAAPDLEEGGWTGRMVEVRRVLGRWFRFRDGERRHPWQPGT
ncbi:hypothetical protein QBC33DRAFT_592008 [Phialemonium atrogriseum]|uniref:Uncharacterized protein n=1 Tax=Phialemonium atrogriseum TaxID=1093897 RepID=A0AAJ0CC52_9PEZI|nr:uncharacterized protein QBC33DRAFT_592008 [Phialemonium atrogriseum]KAK1771561.1 hypothetical protein QBC33DRAFT_592008 [Phialemonium atrogriseum]